MSPFTRLPEEILDLVLAQLPKRDLKVLSRVSKPINAAVARLLWRSIDVLITIDSDWNHIVVQEVRQTHIRHAKHLHLRSNTQCATYSQCPHTQDGLYFEPEFSETISEQTTWILNHLSVKAESLLTRLSDGQLQSFSWNLGTCIPSRILGTNGVIPRNQTSLQSLSLITDYSCPLSADTNCYKDLSSLQSIRKLCWKGPKVDDFDTIRVIIGNNVDHLRELQLDLIDWRYLIYNVQLKNEYDAVEFSYFADRIFQFGFHDSHINLPALQTLWLAHLPLTSSMARTINFDQLRSMTLRKCPAWHDFIKEILKLRLSIRLTTLEIQIADELWSYDKESVLSNFLGAFEGLQRLFLSTPEIASIPNLWTSVLRHHKTLQRLAQQQITRNFNLESSDYGKLYNILDLGIHQDMLHHLSRNISENPFVMPSLECISLPLQPKTLKSIMYPFRNDLSLQLLHIRQSISDLESIALDSFMDTSDRAPLDLRQGPIIARDYSSSGDSYAMFSPATEIGHFAQWAFGPSGVPTLEVIAYGSFAPTDFGRLRCFFLCRGTGFSYGYHLITPKDYGFNDVLYEYSDVLESCPVDVAF